MDKKNIWIVANWKSNKSIEEALDWVSKVGPSLEKKDHIKVVVCPTFIALEEVKKAVQVGNFPLLVGSQDLSPFDSGAHTGEEAAQGLEGLVDLSILGHSERRQSFGESDKMVSEKVTQANTHHIIPLVCVQGEETPVPEGCSLIAYEPIFAIGTGNPDTPEDAQKVSQAFKNKYSGVEVLYGGSVKPENARKFLEVEEINGLLIGGASLDPEAFLAIVESSYSI